MSWTDQRIATLKELWTSGKSASQIANEMGGVSRNGVIGKAYRLRLAAKSNTAMDKPRKLQVKKVKKTKAATAVKPPRTEPNARRSFAFGNVASVMQDEPVVLTRDEPTLVSYDQLEAHHCRYIPGEPAGEHTRYCGCQAVEGLPYCETHARRLLAPSAAVARPYPSWSARAGVRADVQNVANVAEFTS